MFGLALENAMLTYDAGNRVTQAADTASGTFTYSYDGLDRMLSGERAEGLDFVWLRCGGTVDVDAGGGADVRPYKLAVLPG